MRSVWFAAVLALAAGVAQGADNGFYLGAGVSQSNIDGFENQNFDLDDTAWKIIAGFRPIDLFGVEATYMDLGDEEASIPGLGTATAKAKAIAAFGVLFLPLMPIDLFAKAGIAQWNVEGGFSGISGASFDEDGTEFAYGAGVQARLGSLAIRGEYEALDIEDTDGADLFTLAFTYTFL
ncbi:MAG: outer membrane beta-barrel protein [Gammaproteobacteria bacterium]